MLQPLLVKLFATLFTSEFGVFAQKHVVLLSRNFFSNVVEAFVRNFSHGSGVCQMKLLATSILLLANRFAPLGIHPSRNPRSSRIVTCLSQPCRNVHVSFPTPPKKKFFLGGHVFFKWV